MTFIICCRYCDEQYEAGLAFTHSLNCEQRREELARLELEDPLDESRENLKRLRNEAAK